MSSDESKKPEPFWTGPGYRGEYQCPHGVGHGDHIHGCDGCCQRDDFPLREKPFFEKLDEIDKIIKEGEANGEGRHDTTEPRL
jgi:hypothetical protein